VKDVIGTYLDHHEPLKTAGDIAAITITVGTIVNLLPALAAALTIVWTAIRIWETKTVQKFIAKLKKK
jgi:hypothetical protein